MQRSQLNIKLVHILFLFRSIALEKTGDYRNKTYYSDDSINKLTQSKQSVDPTIQSNDLFKKPLRIVYVLYALDASSAVLAPTNYYVYYDTSQAKNKKLSMNAFTLFWLMFNLQFLYIFVQLITSISNMPAEFYVGNKSPNSFLLLQNIIPALFLIFFLVMYVMYDNKQLLESSEPTTVAKTPEIEKVKKILDECVQEKKEEKIDFQYTYYLLIANHLLIILKNIIKSYVYKYYQILISNQIYLNKKAQNNPQENLWRE